MRHLCAIICLAVTVAGPGIAQESLTQDQLALRISELAYGYDETASDVQLGYSGRFGRVSINVEIFGCMAKVSQFSDISDVKVLLDLEVEFDLNDVRILKGRDYSNSVASPDGLSESTETDNYYTYSRTADSDRIVANLTFTRNDGANFQYQGVDYAAFRSPFKIKDEDLVWVPLETSLVTLIILNPINEKQLQDLVSTIDEYRRRFCLAIS